MEIYGSSVPFTDNFKNLDYFKCVPINDCKVKLKGFWFNPSQAKKARRKLNFQQNQTLSYWKICHFHQIKNVFSG